MPTPIRVLIVDDIPETRDHLTRLLGFESDMSVVGAASSGREAISMASNLSPDVVLMDINMPEMDGITATEQLSTLVPSAAVVMMSVQGEADYLRRSMLAGAREFLVKPFSSDELSASIRQVHARELEKVVRFGARTAVAEPTAHARVGSREPGQVVAFFSPKGGVGRTTMAVNAAAAAAHNLQKKVVLVDASLQFGDVSVLLNLNPKNTSIADLVPELDAGADIDAVDTFLVKHASGMRVLLAPPSPEMAELVSPASVRRILEALRADYDLVIVDCAAGLNDTTLAVLDVADQIMTVLTLEITSIKNMRLFLEIAERLGYEGNKIRLLLNRADGNLGIRVSDVEQSIGRKVDYSVVSDGRSVVYALNRGVPFVMMSAEAQVSKDVVAIARGLAAAPTSLEAPVSPKVATRKSLFAWR